MVRFPAVFSRVSAICVAVVLGVGCVSVASAQDSGARIRLLEEKLIQASPGSLPAVSYSVRDIGRILGAVRFALPEAGGHALVLTGTGKVWAWGNSQRGQLGVGDTTIHPEWVAVPELDSVVAIAAGAGHSVALRHDGSVWTWGANEYGQSGDGSLWVRNRPGRVQGIRDVVAVVAGALYTLALRQDGTVWAWGSNWTGVAPGVAEKTLLAPVEVRGLEKIEAIWIRGDRPYARGEEGRQWTWGTPDVRPRQVEPLVEPETAARASWPGLLGRDRVVRVVESALEVQEKGETAARIESSGPVVDLQAGWAVGWIEETFLEPATYALASEATVQPGPRAGGAAGALTASTTTLAPSPNPAVFGAPVTLTATVSPSAATGKVTFYDGTTVLGVGTLASGTATLQTNMLPAGSRSLRAHYAGDANYLASTSGLVTQTVNAQPANSFLTAVNYGVGSDPNWVAVGDFNGDGKADLAVTNSGGAGVLLGNGNGTFRAAVNYAAGWTPWSVAVGDFDGDGKADLAVPNFISRNVSVLLGNGDGTFQAAVNYGAGNSPQFVAVGDFNGDGKADLAVTNSNGVDVLVGNGNGTFQEAVSYAAGSRPNSVAVGDFNGDGKADLAVANSGSNNVTVLVGNGNGTFQAAVTYGAGSYPDSVAVGDFNGDGKADLAVANQSSNNVSVLLGNGNGTFQAAVTYGAGYSPLSAAVGDFNGDGKADLAVANSSSNNVSVLLGNGNGTFQAAVTYGAGDRPQSVAAGDFNGDGKADLVVANPGNVSVLLGTLRSFTTLAAAPTPSVLGQLVALTATVSPSTATGQVTFYDGDTVLGVGTLASGTATFETSTLPAGSRSLRAYYGGDATYPNSTSDWVDQTVHVRPANSFLGAVDYGTGFTPNSVAVGDFNGDGKADLAVTNANGVGVLPGNGNGTFQAAVNWGAGTAPWSVAVGDFNGDGKADLAVANGGSDNVSVLLNNGNGTFRAAANYGVGAYPQSVAVGDFNMDGKADLVVANSSSNNVSVLLGSGDGTFQAAVNYAADRNPLSAAIRDFNGDGKADLVVANRTSGNNASVLLGNGDGTFQTAVNYAAGATPWSVTVGDFNGDGKADLALPNATKDTVSVVLGNGNGTFQPAVTYGVGYSPQFVAVGDLNGDGKADLAVTYYSGVDVLLGNGDGTFQAAVDYAAGTNPHSIAVGDFNMDGKADLAVAIYGNNTVSVLLGTGKWAHVSTTTALVAAPNPSTVGQPVTLTATVSPSVATGQVTFYDGATVLGVGTLAGETATFSTSSLPVGSRSLRAYYGGDANYLASTSGWVTQTTNSTTPGLRCVGSMAQLASGGSWKTTITLVNRGVAAARARLNFFNDSGAPLALPISYPLLPLAEPVSLTSVERTLEPGASFSFFTAGPDDAAPLAGWAQMLTDGDISGFAIFRQKVSREQEAVVPLETRNTDDYVLWFNNSGDFATGAAVANAANQPADILVIMRDEAGAIFDTQTIQLPALGHTSFSLAERFTQTRQRIGSLEFRTPQGGQISVLGLRFGGVAFTTIPVLDRPLQTSTTPLSSLIPAGSAAQLASGNYWETTITLVNKGSFAARTKVDFFDNQGNPLVLPVAFPATPGVPAVMISTLERTLAPGASLSLSSTGPVNVEKVGWARLSTDGDVGGFAIFRQDVVGAQEALAPMEIGNPDAWLLWFDNTGTFSSGVAVVNNSITPASVQVIVRDEAGAQIGTQTLDLAGMGHTSFDIASAIANTGGKVGSLEFRTPPGGAITVLGLRFSGVAFTTIPVMPI